MCFPTLHGRGISDVYPEREHSALANELFYVSRYQPRYFESEYGERGTRASYNYSRLKDDADILGRGLPRKLSSTAKATVA